MFRAARSASATREALRLAGACVAGLVLAAAPAAAETGRCVTVRVDAPMVLPDGSVHPAGALTLCDARAFTPTTGLHETFVDGRAVGMFTSTIRVNESGADAEPAAIFEVDADGRMRLVGYVVPSRGHSVSYQLRSALASTEATLVAVR